MKITKKAVQALKAPTEGQIIKWDDEIKGFGVRVMASGVRSFVLAYRAHKRQRVYSIGRFPEWSVVAARDEAYALRKRIGDGEDPMGDRQAVRGEPSFADLLNDYLESEEFERKRPHTQRDYRRVCEKILRPAWGPMRLKAIQSRDVEALHASMKATPYQANRVLSMASRLFNFAIERRMLDAASPARNVKHHQEEKRARYLNQEDQTEMARFGAALDNYPDQNAANALRLLLLTGSRSGEVLKATWSQFNLRNGIWTKPSSSTKQKKEEHVPLNEPALALLRSMKTPGAAGPLFPGRDGKKARVGLRRPWLQACKAAGLVEVFEIPGKRGPVKCYKPVMRVHDLRHTFASHLVSNGVSLPIVGKLLGHNVAATTQRYAHFSIEGLRAGTNVGGKVLEFERKRA